MKDLNRLNDVLDNNECDCGLLCDDTCKYDGWDLCHLPVVAIFPDQWKTTTTTEEHGPDYICWDLCGIRGMHVVATIFPDQWKTTAAEKKEELSVEKLTGSYHKKRPWALVDGQGNTIKVFRTKQQATDGLDVERSADIVPVMIESSEMPSQEIVDHVASLDHQESPSITGSLEDMAETLTSMKEDFAGWSDMCQHWHDDHRCNHWDNPVFCKFEECPRLGN